MDREGLSRLMRRISALERRVHALFRTGRVAAVGVDPYRVRVDIGPDDDGAPVVTDWLPVLVPRAGAVRAWTPCTVGERVAVLSPGGEDAATFVLPALHSDDFEAPSTDANQVVEHHADGAQFSYDQAAHRYRIGLPAGSRVVVEAGTIVLSGATETLTIP